MRSFVVGGPWYGSKLDVRTMMTVTELVGWARHHGYESRAIISEDTQLDLARNLLMDTAIRSRADWFISIDADCSIRDPRSIFPALDVAYQAGHALVGFPARCGDGRWNVVIDDKTIESPLDKPREVEKVGFGCVAFRLGWYVKNWPSGAPFFHTFTMRNQDTKRFMTVGEDYGHCNMVRTLGGKVSADPHVKVIHHTARPGSPASRIDTELAG